MTIRFPEAKYKINQLVSEHNSASIGEFIALGKSVNSSSEAPPPYMRPLSVAFVSSFTMTGLPETFSARALFHNIFSKTYAAPYNQVGQEILNPQSHLYEHAPQIVYLIVDSSEVASVSEIYTFVDALLQHSRAEVVVFNFSTLTFPRALTFNTDIVSRYTTVPRVHVFDFDSYIKNNGGRDIWYTKYKELGDIRLLPQAFIQLSELLCTYAVARAGATKKCLVLDFDDTLWRGTLSEDGKARLVPDKKIQKQILTLAQTGVLLAGVSKNDEAPALDVFETHPDMLLRTKDLSAWRINWNPKNKNLFEIAHELNLGLESFVVVDDSSLERVVIERSFPEVAVMSPELIYQYAGFAKSSVTTEDLKRKDLYDDEKKRQEFQDSFKSSDDFLRELHIQVWIEVAQEDTIARISQLTQKTNQCNVTTRRYSEDDIRDHIARGARVLSVRATDRFGDYGVIGVVIIVPKLDSSWHIDSLLLSCRILGRGIEKALIASILEEARVSGVERVTAEFIPTEKNTLARSFFEQSGFTLVDPHDESGLQKNYVYNVESFECVFPDFLTVHRHLKS